MPLSPQDNSGVEENASQGNSAATSPAPKDNLAIIGSASLPVSSRNKGKKRRRASSGGGQGNLPNTRGPKVAGAIRRSKRGGEAGSWDANPSPAEQKSDRSPQGGRDPDAEPRMFAGVIVQHFDNDIRCSLKVHTMI